MSWQIKDIVVNDERKNVTIKFENRDSWGRVSKREQKTFSLYHLKRALKKANITVPLDQLMP